MNHFYSDSTVNKNLQYSFQSTSSHSILINDVEDSTELGCTKSIDFKGITMNERSRGMDNISLSLPLIFSNDNEILVPKKIQYTLKNYVPKYLLKKIHPDLQTSIELCLITTSLLIPTYYDEATDSTTYNGKCLKAEYLRELFSNSGSTYKNIVNALAHETNVGPLVECDKIAIKGVKSFSYKLGSHYYRKGIEKYKLQSKLAISTFRKYRLKSFQRSIQDPICRYLIDVYPRLTLPTQEVIVLEAKRLQKLDFHTKRGKKLTFLNKHSKTYFKNIEEYVFVEDSTKWYKSLTDTKLMIPQKGSAKSGGRVVDSITLMPSWIRNLIKIDGENLVECDFKSLHPNLSCSIYEGSSEFITHEKVAESLGISVHEVKRKHLSFFNSEVLHMQNSALYEFYLKNDPNMLDRIIKEKIEFGHKITSQKLFTKEVEIMTEIISQLSNEEIPTLYVYDAFLCKARDSVRVKKIMDTVLLNHSIKTTVNISYGNRRFGYPVNGYEGYYEIDQTGQVLSLFSNKVISQRVDRAGYYTVRLSKPGCKTATKYVHRLLGEVFIGIEQSKTIINHIDGCKQNNAIDNLEWSTHSENIRHAYQCGLISVPRERVKKVWNKCSGKIFESIKKAAEFYSIPYSTCKNYLNGNRSNPTCLSYMVSKSAA
jgi:hypothetical protein